MGKPLSIYNYNGSRGRFAKRRIPASLSQCRLWSLGMESQIADKAKVDLVVNIIPNPIGMAKYKTGVKPADLK